MGIIKSKTEEQIEALIKKDEKELLFLLKDIEDISKVIEHIHLKLNKIFSEIITLKKQLYLAKKNWGKNAARIDKNTRLLEYRRNIEHEIDKLEAYLDKLIKREKHEIYIEKIIRENLNKAIKKLEELE